MGPPSSVNEDQMQIACRVGRLVEVRLLSLNSAMVFRVIRSKLKGILDESPGALWRPYVGACTCPRVPWL